MSEKKYPNKRSFSGRRILEAQKLTVAANAYVRVSPESILIPVDSDGVSNPNYSNNEVFFSMYKDNQLQSGWSYTVDSTTGCDAAIVTSPSDGVEITNVVLPIAAVIIRGAKSGELDITFAVYAYLLERGEKGDKGDKGEAAVIGNWLGAWVSQNYVETDMVSYQGSSYTCILDTVSNEPPTNTTYWNIIAQKGSDGADGADGADAPAVQYEYQNTDSGWTGTENSYTGTEQWIRVSLDGGTTWSSSIKFVGDDGAQGPQGDPGEGVYPAGYEEFIDPVTAVNSASVDSNYVKMELTNTYSSTSRFLTIPDMVNFTAVIVDITVDKDATGDIDLSYAAAGSKAFVNPGERLVVWFIKNGSDVDIFTIYDSSQIVNKIEEYNSGIKQEIIEIGDWDMVTNGSKTITFSATYANIVGVTVLVRNDTDTERHLLDSTSTATGARGSISKIESTGIELIRFAVGLFDSVDYDSTSYNRGWVIIDYI